MTLSNQKRSGSRSASGRFEKPTERLCDRCGQPYQPARFDSKTCGANCPGKPDQIRICLNPDCALHKAEPRLANGKVLGPGEYVVKGSSRGKGNQQYCSEKCRDHVARIRWGQRFRRYDGLTREEFIAAGETRNWKCDICGRVPEPDSRKKLADELPYLVVDHHHGSGRRRGLLCGPCNTAIGLLGDDPKRAEAAAVYLRAWAEKP